MEIALLTFWQARIMLVPTGFLVESRNNAWSYTVVGGWAIQQLWLFWVAPVLGAVIAAMTYGVFERGNSGTVSKF